MELLFPIFRYFPHGGLQRDMLQIAEYAAKRGHSVTVCTMHWEGAYPASPRIAVKLIAPKGWSNHGRALHFAREVEALKAEGKYDLTVGFNRIPGLDFYFAGDNCFAKTAAKHSFLIRLLPRYRVFLALERAVFDSRSDTRILCITPRQIRDFQQEYGTGENRFTLLPPGISPAFRRPAGSEEKRRRKRGEFRAGLDEILLLQVGSGFRTKGVDRTLRAFAALPLRLRGRTRLLIAGRDPGKRYPALAEKLDLHGRVLFLGPRDDVPELMLAADLLIHPARNEAAGSVLVESLAEGTPVLCTANCGFADYVEQSGGTVLSEPFQQEEFNASLTDLLVSHGKLDRMKSETIRYGAQGDFYRRAEVAVKTLEENRK